MCSCDAEFRLQPVAIYNVVIHPPTETNQMTSDNVGDTKSEVAGSVVDENFYWNCRMAVFPLISFSGDFEWLIPSGEFLLLLLRNGSSLKAHNV